MVTALRDPDFDEAGKGKHGRHGSIAAARVAPHTDPIEIDPGVALGKLLDSADLIRDGIHADVVEVLVMKGLRPLGIPHALNLDNYEAKLGQRIAIRAGGLKRI